MRQSVLLAVFVNRMSREIPDAQSEVADVSEDRRMVPVVEPSGRGEHGRQKIDDAERCTDLNEFERLEVRRGTPVRKQAGNLRISQ